MYIMLSNFTIPPSAKVLSVLVFVYAVVRVLKMAPALKPYMQGWVSLAVNGVFSLLGLLVAIPPAQLYNLSTLGTTFVSWLTIVTGAAGIHGTIQSFTTPTVVATIPPSTRPLDVPAVIVPLDPAAVVIPEPLAKPEAQVIPIAPPAVKNGPSV